MLVAVYRHFGTACRSHRRARSPSCWTLEDGTVRLFRNFGKQHTLCNIPEERRPQLHRGEAWYLALWYLFICVRNVCWFFLIADFSDVFWTIILWIYVNSKFCEVRYCLCSVKYCYANSWELRDMWNHLECLCVNALDMVVLLLTATFMSSPPLLILYFRASTTRDIRWTWGIWTEVASSFIFSKSAFKLKERWTFPCCPLAQKEELYCPVGLHINYRCSIVASTLPFLRTRREDRVPRNAFFFALHAPLPQPTIIIIQ